jgi:hypothetical protein
MATGENKGIDKGSKTGLFEVEFINDFGSYKAGEKANYHISTAKSLESKKIVKIGKELKNYVPKTIKE